MTKQSFPTEQRSQTREDVIDDFLRDLHRGLVEYKGINGDYLGEELWHQIGPRGYYHLLCFLDEFTGRYQWEPGIAGEYLGRLGTIEHWRPYQEEERTWKPRSK